MHSDQPSSCLCHKGIDSDIVGFMQLLEDQESADEEFWNQDFFAEEEKDQEFEASESEQEDVPDSDFSEEVSNMCYMMSTKPSCLLI